MVKSVYGQYGTQFSIKQTNNLIPSTEQQQVKLMLEVGYPKGLC